LKSELTEVEIKLKHNFNVLHPETEIDSILAIRNKLDQINVGAYTEILESDNSVELIQELSRLHPKIQQLNHLVKFTFELEQIGSFVEIEQHLLKLEQVQAILVLIIEEMKAYYEADSLLRGFVKRNEVSVAQLNAIVIYHHIINQNRFEQAFVKLTGDTLFKEIKSKAIHQKKFLKASATNIEMKVESSLKAAELFMATAASKLKEDEKAQKKSYKAQKKLIIHEIAKKQQHLSVKEFSTECWELLSKIQKVWVMNPLAVSERLACEKELFDVVIFDEASQIPLEDAIPAIYRAKQIVVVGDDKQMPPSTFFSSNSGSLTLLDKASLSFSKEMFKWHYRSEHPALIQFSNKQFYDDELLTFPSNRADSPISFHLIDGLFKDGANLKETEAIAQYVSTKSDLTKIGIVAFSKEQEKTIHQSLSKLKIDTTDLLIRNLENTQGIEKDEIIISIGYAKNEDGVFRMNFGPVNQENGPNRLNVLFSRAKKKMTVFSSVTATDFKLSDNAGVSCLRDFMSYAASNQIVNKSTDSNVSFYGIELPSGVQKVEAENGNAVRCWVNQERTKVLLLDPGMEEGRIEDLSTIVSVLSNRFKELKIMLTLDYWNNTARFENELLSFFK
jgi:hypothetical protein